MQTPVKHPSCRPGFRPHSGFTVHSGFTLVETMLAASLMSILFLCAMNLYIEALRSAAKSGAQISANATAANGLQHIKQDVREAYASILPSTIPAPNPAFGTDLGHGYPPAQFQTTYLDPATGTNRTINTGLKIVFPATKASHVFSTGGTVLAPQYDISAAGAAVYIYRADFPANPGAASPAVPDPAAGDCLWASGTENGVAINRCLARLSDSRSGAAAANTIPNAVEFLKPPEPNSLEIRLISSYFSPISSAGSTLANQQSSESNKVLLTGKCVFMHNHQ